MLKIEDMVEYDYAKTFCTEFKSSSQPKYIFGRNEFAQSIISAIDVDGFIDDFTDEIEYLGRPIIKIDNVSKDALVVVAVVGKTLIAEKRVKEFLFKSLDYFSFYKYSGLALKQVMFWDGFIEDFEVNRSKYEWIDNLLSDDISKKQYLNIINFRLSYDLNYMRGFQSIEDQLYFEDFLELNSEGETFVDVGGFDGYTSQEFIRLCPRYKSIHIFEPEEKNISLAKQRLREEKSINFHQLGLSDKKQTLKFDVGGSSSKISDTGSVIIEVDKLDDIIDEPVTFIKMDIEGAEADAIEGAKETIKKYHPRLAISVYHKANDFWKIPEQILAIRDDYKIFLRHYTEGIAETVMFFIPIKVQNKL